MAIGVFFAMVMFPFALIVYFLWCMYKLQGRPISMVLYVIGLGVGWYYVAFDYGFPGPFADDTMHFFVSIITYVFFMQMFAVIITPTLWFPTLGLIFSMILLSAAARR